MKEEARAFKYSLLVSIIIQILIWGLFIIKDGYLYDKFLYYGGSFLICLIFFTLLYFLLTNALIERKKINSNSFNICMLIVSIPLSIIFMVLCVEINSIIDPNYIVDFGAFGVSKLREISFMFYVISVVDSSVLLKIIYEIIFKSKKK